MKFCYRTGKTAKENNNLLKVAFIDQPYSQFNALAPEVDIQILAYHFYVKCEYFVNQKR